MSVKVDLDRLSEALADYRFAYLITVGDDSLRVVPDRAVLHRKAGPQSAPKPGCTDDCVPLEG